MMDSYCSLLHGHGRGTVQRGSPAAAACASTRFRRTACIATRSATSLKVVSSPTISYSSRPRSRCRAQALSFPLLQESRIRFIAVQPARVDPNYGPLKLISWGELEPVRERFPPGQRLHRRCAVQAGKNDCLHPLRTHARFALREASTKSLETEPLEVRLQLPRRDSRRASLE